MIELDGSTGEGDGQVLRTALTLSMITGQAFHIANIRAGRAKPGLMRQHLIAVQAAAQVSDAMVTNAEVGSQALTIMPKRIKSGDYQFAIGSAGSCTLVLQTLLPALLYGDSPSTIRVTGGTHNPMAPPAVGEHLADQVMLPMALAGEGRFLLEQVSQHVRTNAEIIARFLPVSITFEAADSCAICVVQATGKIASKKSLPLPGPVCYSSPPR